MNLKQLLIYYRSQKSCRDSCNSDTKAVKKREYRRYYKDEELYPELEENDE